MTMDYWVLNGHRPVKATRDEWAKFLDKGTRIIKQERIESVLISTVFLGIDHNWGSHGPPILFETMIFHDDKNTDYQERYVTWDEAIEGHDRAVAEVIRHGYPPQKEDT